jgi:hypothetical protein
MESASLRVSHSGQIISSLPFWFLDDLLHAYEMHCSQIVWPQKMRILGVLPSCEYSNEHLGQFITL